MTRVIGIGVDLVRIGRFRSLMDRQDVDLLLDQFFSTAEWAAARRSRDPAAYLAGRFAVKEAFLKAVGIGLTADLRLPELEVLDDDAGQPTLRWPDAAGRLLALDRGCNVKISVSVGAEHALATVFLVRPSQPLS